MIAIQRISPLARAILVIGVVAALVTSVTFAALNSQVTLTNNTISSADASLSIWNGAEFASTAPGFTIEDLVPGETTAEKFFYFKNNGDTALRLRVVATTPTLIGVAPEKVKVLITGYAPGCNAEVRETDLSEIDTVGVDLPCDPLPVGAQGDSGVQEAAGNFSIAYFIAPEDVSGNNISITNLDYVFEGTVVATP